MTHPFVHQFAWSEDGAVTVDWMVLTAGILVFGVIVAVLVGNAATGTSASVGTNLATATVPAVDFEGP